MHAGDLLSKRAYLTPDREAMLELPSGRRCTYAELDARANRAANFLRHKLGVEKGDRVSILAHNGVAYVDLFYGLAKIGAILAPLNWRLAAPELVYIVNDNQPRMLVCGPEFVDKLAEMQPEIDVAHYVSLEGAEIGKTSEVWCYEDELAQASSAEPQRPPLEADDTCAILYTSGTTGRPKGAMIPHRQVLWNAINTVVSWGLSENDVSPVFTPLFHAGGLFIFMTPLFYVGGRIILFRTFDLDAIFQTILDEKCTVVLGVPTIYRMLMNHPGFDDADFGHVRFFISGGAPLPVELVETWLKAKGGVFRQGYGLTEVGANCFSMTNEESVWKLGSVGKPIFHSKVRLRNPDTGQDAPVGQEGELLIAGPHVCTGYWRNPQASARALLDEPGGPWFRTGDMARRDEDGFYYIIGRYKDMIKSGGENIYAAEVEAVFTQHPAVREAALIGMPYEKWGEVGLMVVVLEEGQTAAEEELKAFCGEHLARFKIPKKVVFADALPYSSYGKVMKAELKKKFVG